MGSYMMFCSGRTKETVINQNDILSLITIVTKNLRNINGNLMSPKVFRFETNKDNLFKLYLKTSLFLLGEV